MKIQLPGICVTTAIIFNILTASAQYVTPIKTLAVPMITAPIVIDGDADASYSDWQTTMICMEEGKGVTPHSGDTSDFNFRFRLTWDFNYLYLVADIIDDVYNYYVIGKDKPHTYDNVELYIDLDTNSTTQVYSSTSTTEMRFSLGLLDSNGKDSLIESNRRGAGGPGTDSSSAFAIAQRKQYKFYADYEKTIEGKTGWHFEVAIPWSAATDSASVDIHDLTQENGGTVVGFDVSGEDSDDSYGEGGLNVAGGAQSFWDLDDPLGTGSEANAPQNRLVFGFIQLTGTPCSCDGIGINYTHKASEINVIPNPATSQITFLNLQNMHSAEILNLLGQPIRSIEIYEEKITIDISDLPSGIYFFKPDNAESAVMFIKQ